MTDPRIVDLTPTEATDQIQQQLQQADDTLRCDDLDSAFDAYVHALGLALQLGSVPTEQALAAILDGSRYLADHHHSDGLATLGPALVDLVAQVCRVGALPPTGLMEAWAVIASDLGTLIGQVGLALCIAPDHREGMMQNARQRALFLDEATGNLFGLSKWLEGSRLTR